MKKLLALLVCVAVVAMCFSFVGCKKDGGTKIDTKVETPKGDTGKVDVKVEAKGETPKVDVKVDTKTPEAPKAPAN